MNPSRSPPASSDRHKQLLFLEELRRLDHQRHHQYPQDIGRGPGMDLSRLIRAEQAQVATLMGGARFPEYLAGGGTVTNGSVDSLRIVDEISRLRRTSFGGGLNGMMAPSSSHSHRNATDQGMEVSKFALSPGSFPSVQGPFELSRIFSRGSPVKNVTEMMGGLIPSGIHPSIQDEKAIINSFQHPRKGQKNRQSRRDGTMKVGTKRRRSHRINSCVVLPSLTSQRSLVVPMKSFRILWESPAMASHTHDIRKELFVRKIARGRVPILDNSERLPRGRNLLVMGRN